MSTVPLASGASFEKAIAAEALISEFVIVPSPPTMTFAPPNWSSSEEFTVSARSALFAALRHAIDSALAMRTMPVEETDAPRDLK